MKALNILFKTPIFVFFFANLIIFFLLILALNPHWRYHLEPDVKGFYYPRYVEFVDTHSFLNVEHNEYFPGAMFFFLLPGILIYNLPKGYETYLTGIFIINIILVWLSTYIYKKTSVVSPYVFLTILFFSGPLIFYRHDLFVSLFVILSIVMFAKKPNRAIFLLGIATTIKIYPILIAPYYFLIEIRKKRPATILLMLVSYIMGITLPVIAYFLLSPKLTSLAEPLIINAIKPVHIESTWASLLTVASLISNGHWARGLGANGIFGVAPGYIYFPIGFYNYFWLLPIGLFYILIIKKGKKHFQTEIVFLIVLLFELFSKILTPQYLFWFLLILPLIKFKKSKNLIITTVLCSIIFLVTQYIYPLHYSELLASFYKDGTKSIFFYLLFFRNVLLVVLFISIFRITFIKND